MMERDHDLSPPKEAKTAKYHDTFTPNPHPTPFNSARFARNIFMMHDKNFGDDKKKSYERYLPPIFRIVINRLLPVVDDEQ